MNAKIAVSSRGSRAAARVADRGRRRPLLIGSIVAVSLVALVGALVLTRGHARDSRRPASTAAAPSRRHAPKPLYAHTEARVFGWPRVRRASSYDVRLFRAGVKIFEARTAATRLAVPRRWTFDGRRLSLRPGNYVWQVRPRFGRRRAARYGAPIVAAKLVVRRDAR